MPLVLQGTSQPDDGNLCHMNGIHNRRITPSWMYWCVAPGTGHTINCPESIQPWCCIRHAIWSSLEYSAFLGSRFPSNSTSGSCQSLYSNYKIASAYFLCLLYKLPTLLMVFADLMWSTPNSRSRILSDLSYHDVASAYFPCS